MTHPMFLFRATLFSIFHTESHIVNRNHLLQPRSSTGRHRLKGLDSQSWRLAVENNNLQGWKCEGYIGHCMLGKQYRRDCDAVADAATKCEKSVKPAGDRKDVWVFDIDETTLSNLPYYARSDVQFGAIAHNDTRFKEWVEEETAPPLPAIRRLYKTVLSLRFKTVLLTGTSEKFKDTRIVNLHNAGYYNWEKLIVRGEADKGSSVIAYKSERRRKLVKQGHRIVGNVGDQWSDLLGENARNRTFKVPDPMYYIA